MLDWMIHSSVFLDSESLLPRKYQGWANQQVCLQKVGSPGDKLSFLNFWIGCECVGTCIITRGTYQSILDKVFDVFKFEPRWNEDWWVDHQSPRFQFINLREVYELDDECRCRCFLSLFFFFGKKILCDALLVYHFLSVFFFSCWCWKSRWDYCSDVTYDFR